MSNRTPWLLALIVFGALPIAAQAQKSTASCPEEAPKMRRIATHFANWPMYLEARGIHHLPTLDSAQVRTLTVEAGDGETCAKLLQLVQSSDTALASTGFRLTFFQAGEHYYIVGVCADRVDPPPPGTIRLGGWSVLWVVTATSEPVVVARIAV
jgi:hypothetical protein